MTLPNHLFVSSCDGALYDTRMINWSSKSIRPIYERTFVTINNVAEFKATLRNGAYAWPGGYQMYFITSDGAALSFDGAREAYRQIVDSIVNKSNDGWRVINCSINYEEDDLYCAHTNARIPSAYGERE